MADLFWDRIEPHSRDPHLEAGLAASVADPLWMLGRQWQVGEFRGEDAASPIDISLSVAHMPITSFRNEGRSGGQGAEAEPLPHTRPLETRVEAEAVPSGRARLAMAAEIGLDLLRRFDEAGLGELRAPLRQHYPLIASEADREGLPAADLPRLSLLTRRSLDGLRLLREEDDKLAAAFPASLRSKALPIWRRWAEATRRLVEQPGPSGETWIGDRLEHGFSLAAQAKGEEVVLSASQYPGGRLDWHAFDIDPISRPHADEELADAPGLERQSVQVLAVPLAYTGMPAARHWQFEEGEVYFGGIEGGPADLGRMLLTEFATICSDDWYLLPVRLPIGSLARIDSMSVRNTFGERLPIKSTAVWDRGKGGSTDRLFAMFELSGDPSAAEGKTPWLPLVPNLASTLHGEPLERVSFVRDEAANLAWAIEERVEIATGRSLPRRLMSGIAMQEARRRDEEDNASPPDGIGPEDPWRYRLQRATPPYWIPLLPERPDERSPATKLRRARMLAWSELDDLAHAGAKGRVLTPDRPFTLHEEEVPAGGVQVTRRWQVARSVDGGFHVWLARHKRPGRGERGSGLRFDQTLRD